jgi:hypothetical protein
MATELQRKFADAIRKYQRQSEALPRDFPHRDRNELKSVSKRLGWKTWKVCSEVLPESCR